MHQPTYRPGQSIFETENSGAFSFSIVDVHNQRFGPYTGWPRNAIQNGSGLPNLGASVSFSGSLMRNLYDLENAGVNGGQWNSWENAYRQAAGWQTTEGNRRLDIVNFGFNHPLMPLLDERDISMQIRLQKHIMGSAFPNVPASKGIFPPETAFSTRIIPALVGEGIEWAIVDSIHVERATVGYPHTLDSGLYQPNAADQINPDLSTTNSQWVNLNGLWAPSAVAAPFAYQPHNVQHVDPETGQITKMVIVPGARYEGNEDGRGGYGALQYENVMEQYRQLNTDPDHPMLVLLHHDGDNFGGGSESYYNGNFSNMVNWLNGNNNYNATTIQDYLDRFPVDANDLVHIENGSWAGADNGDPEFKKWLGDPGADGFSPDRNSWAVLTAARNRVFTAEDIAPAGSLDNIINGVGTSTERAWHTLLQAEGSDHWYWDGEEVWDSNVTLGSNEAVSFADQVINGFGGVETTPPTVFVPQREPYNPGGFEFGGSTEPSDFEVWTYAYDVSGLQSVVLKYRVDVDGLNPLDSIQNETYAGGAEVGDWQSLEMASSDVNPPGNLLSPTYRALKYSAMIEGENDVLIDYYVEATDSEGVITKTNIQHVYVGASTTGGGGDQVVISPDPAVAGQSVLIEYDSSGGPLANANNVQLYHGINDWETLLEEVPMQYDSELERWVANVVVPISASQLDMVFNDGNGTWDNNSGQDWHFEVEGAVNEGFEMDGQLDDSANLIASNGDQNLYVALSSTNQLYIATDDAGEGNDVFIYVAQNPGELLPANWAKSGLVAAWDGYLADENDNDYHSWFDLTGQSATGTNGGVLEGVLDLPAIYGERPDSIWLAVGCFASQDGGQLQTDCQVPASTDGNGDLEALEWVEINLVQTDVFVPNTYEVIRGVYSSGTTTELQQSDNQDLVVIRNSVELQARVHVSVSNTTEIASPTSIELKLESSVFARAPIDIKVDFYDFDSNSWVEVGTGVASRFSDSTITVSSSDAPERFVESGTGKVESRIRYESSNRRQRFSASIDQVEWTIAN